MYKIQTSNVKPVQQYNERQKSQRVGMVSSVPGNMILAKDSSPNCINIRVIFHEHLRMTLTNGQHQPSVYVYPAGWSVDYQGTLIALLHCSSWVTEENMPSSGIFMIPLSCLSVSRKLFADSCPFRFPMTDAVDLQKLVVLRKTASNQVSVIFLVGDATVCRHIVPGQLSLGPSLD